MYTLRNILIVTNIQEIECFDTESGDNIISVGLHIQGLCNVDIILWEYSKILRSLTSRIFIYVYMYRGGASDQLSQAMA